MKHYLKRLITYDALNNKGVALIYLGKYDEAISYIDEAISKDANYVYALNNKGAALIYLGKYDEAIGYIDKALAIDPDNVDINKGTALDGYRSDEAIPLYDLEALAIDLDYLFSIE